MRRTTRLAAFAACLALTGCTGGGGSDDATDRAKLVADAKDAASTYLRALPAWSQQVSDAVGTLDFAKGMVVGKIETPRQLAALDATCANAADLQHTLDAAPALRRVDAAGNAAYAKASRAAKTAAAASSSISADVKQYSAWCRHYVYGVSEGRAAARMQKAYDAKYKIHGSQVLHGETWTCHSESGVCITADTSKYPAMARSFLAIQERYLDAERKFGSTPAFEGTFWTDYWKLRADAIGMLDRAYRAYATALRFYAGKATPQGTHTRLDITWQKQTDAYATLTKRMRELVTSADYFPKSVVRAAVKQTYFGTAETVCAKWQMGELESDMRAQAAALRG